MTGEGQIAGKAILRKQRPSAMEGDGGSSRQAGKPARRKGALTLPSLYMSSLFTDVQRAARCGVQRAARCGVQRNVQLQLQCAMCKVIWCDVLF